MILKVRKIDVVMANMESDKMMDKIIENKKVFHWLCHDLLPKAVRGIPYTEDEMDLTIRKELYAIIDDCKLPNLRVVGGEEDMVEIDLDKEVLSSLEFSILENKALELSHKTIKESKEMSFEELAEAVELIKMYACHKKKREGSFKEKDLEDCLEGTGKFVKTKDKNGNEELTELRTFDLNKFLGI